MNGKQLKNSILQWAIQGKLVPQNPKDEPASKLLERIAAARNGDGAVSVCHPERSAKGTKSKDLAKKKKSKNETSRIYREGSSWFEQVGSAQPKDITEEIPFDIPESWEWCRLDNIFIHETGKTLNKATNNDGVMMDYLTTSNVYWNAFDFSGMRQMRFKESEIERYSVKKGDLLVLEGGEYRGRTAVWNLDKVVAYQNHLHRLRSYVQFEPYYYSYVMQLYRSNGMILNISKGEAIPAISSGALGSLILPLPPVAEQKRIVKKLEQILPLVDEYDQAQTQLDKLNKELPEALKKSILQQAIQGKLVPQNPKDEPAQKLLERIFATRNGCSTNQGVILSEAQSAKSKNPAKKKSKNETSRIYRNTDGLWYEQTGSSEPVNITEEIPFEIPETWTWCRLGEIFLHQNGKQLNEANRIGSPQKYITTSNLYWDHFVLDNLRSMYFTEEELSRCTATKGDLLVCEGGDIGRSAIWNEEYDICIQNHIHKLRPYVDVCVKFFWHILFFYKKTGKIGGKGIGIQGLSSKALHNILVPLPPLAEQKRIVAKLEQLFKAL